MPRNIRNFWVELKVDGRATRVATGPRAANGGLDLDLYQRDEKDIRKVLSVRCYAEIGGVLGTRILSTEYDEKEHYDRTVELGYYKTLREIELNYPAALKITRSRHNVGDLSERKEALRAFARFRTLAKHLTHEQLQVLVDQLLVDKL